MKPIAAGIIIFTGAYLLIGACQTGYTGNATPPLEAIGYATIAVDVWVLFVGWAEPKAAEKRLWQRFSIRDLFWFTLLAALLVAWWMDHQSMQSKIPFTTSPIPVVGQQNSGNGNLFGGGGF